MERGFSRSGLMVTKHRNKLADQSVRAGVLLSSWEKIPGIVPQRSIIDVFNNKSKRPTKATEGDKRTSAEKVTEIIEVNDDSSSSNSSDED
jgi:hypothetical protein